MDVQLCQMVGRIYSMAEVRRTSNLFWAIFTLLGSLGLLFVAISSYLGMDLFFVIWLYAGAFIFFTLNNINTCYRGQIFVDHSNMHN